MATDSNVRSVTNTLTTTVADTITILQPWPYIAVTNYDGTNAIGFRQDGTTAVADADGVTMVPISARVVRKASVNSSGNTVVSIVGSGGKYTIEGVIGPNI